MSDNENELPPATGSSLYAERDPMQLDQDGGYYYRHVRGMTKHGLHSKSDIAAELAWRDRECDHWRRKYLELLKEKRTAKTNSPSDQAWRGELSPAAVSVGYAADPTQKPEYRLAMEVLQSDLYAGCSEVKRLVDQILAAAKPEIACASPNIKSESTHDNE